MEGDVTLTADYQCRMIYLEKETTLKEGDLIVTSNSVGIFPQAISSVRCSPLSRWTAAELLRHSEAVR